MSRGANIRGFGLALLWMLLPGLLPGAGDGRALAQPLREVHRVHLDDIVTGRDGERAVELYVRAVTRYGEPVKDLRNSDVRVHDAGERIDPEDLEVQTLAASGRGMTCVIAIDTSRTMRGKAFNRARSAALEFVKLLEGRDRVAVVTFSDEVEVLVPFSASRSEARARLEQLEVNPESLRTVMNDGLHKAIEIIRLGEELPRRAFVIAFSDGKDAGSHRSMGQVTEFALGNANEPPILVFSIGYARFGGDGLEVLENLSDETGGAFLHAETSSQMSSFFSSTRWQMKDSLVIRYEGEMDGDEHDVAVTISGESDSRSTRYADIPRPILPWVIAGLLLLLVVAAGLLVAKGRTGGRLVFLTGPLSGQAVQLAGAKTNIGAMGDNDIVLAWDTISRHHATIFCKGRRAEIRDLDSSNGTFVNETPIRTGPLKRGDRIRFADVEATFEQ